MWREEQYKAHSNLVLNAGERLQFPLRIYFYLFNILALNSIRIHFETRKTVVNM